MTGPRPRAPDNEGMISHDLVNFAALLLSGVVGALVSGPLGNAMKLAARRVRSSNRDR